MGLFSPRQSKCQFCGGILPAENANFCPHCGKPQGRGRVTCPHCHAVVPADSSFCPACGKQLRSDVPPTMQGNVWRKSPDDFAARVEVGDVPGYFRKELVVDAGNRALIMVNGRHEGELGPGRYTMDDIFHRILALGKARVATAIVVDAGDVSMDFTIPGVSTSDPVKIAVDCRLRLQLQDPVRFLTNWMKGQRTVAVAQLRQDLFDEVKNALADVLRGYPVRDLHTNLALKESIATAVEAHLNETFKQMGLHFAGVRAFNFRQERWDAVQQKREDLYLQVSAEEAEVEGKRRLLDVISEKDLVELADETRQVDTYEKRAQIWARMRQAAASDKMSQAMSEEEFEAFLTGLDRGRLLRDEEMDTLRREVGARKDDWERARHYLLTKAGLEQERELRMYELATRRDLEVGGLELQQEIERRKVDEQLAADEKRFTAGLERQRRAQQLEQESLSGDLTIAMQAMRELKQVKADEARAAQELVLEGEARRHELEMQRLQQLSQASMEALIATSGPEQARVLADLRRTDMLKGLSEEQILALAAERSPEVARALQEKFRGLPAEEQKAMYERLVQAEKGSREEQAQLTRDTMATMERLFGRAADAIAQRPAGPPTVVMGGAGPTPMVVGSQAQGEVWVCRRCHASSPVGTKFCPNCGEPFFS